MDVFPIQDRFTLPTQLTKSLTCTCFQQASSLRRPNSKKKMPVVFEKVRGVLFQVAPQLSLPVRKEDALDSLHHILEMSPCSLGTF